jgi:hypothetical protein
VVNPGAWGRRLVRYSSPDVAQQAIETLNGRDLDGRKLHVREDRSYIESAAGIVVFVVRRSTSVECPQPQYDHSTSAPGPPLLRRVGPWFDVVCHVCLCWAWGASGQPAVVRDE